MTMIERTQYLNQLIQFKDTDFIKVITGVRRCGKSVLLQQYRDYLKSTKIKESSIIYINFESFDYQFIRDEVSFHNLLESILPKKGKFYLLIDEIQFVENWQKVINSVRASFSCDIVITGSNAKMLSGELATFLSGRYVEIPIYPLSFREFLLAKNISEDSRYVDSAYLEYETYGGFPGVVLADESIKDTILSGIFDSIVLNDIAYRANLKDTPVLNNVVRFMADNVGQLINSSKIANTLKSEHIDSSVHTINRYIELLTNAFLFFQAKQYDLRGKEYLKTNSKYFMVDNGLRRYAVGQRTGNFGNRLENIIYIELLRRGYSIDVGRIQSKEIDFICRRHDEILYVQVTYQMPENTHESDNLLLIPDNFKKIIITGRYSDTKEISGIPILYIVDWLLQD